ncbi:MAG: hypothetical protein MK212_10770 [Saprospiraceae bacterium]|nr:hypothetical protein [Saprospiraceae bacterium]
MNEEVLHLFQLLEKHQQIALIKTLNDSPKLVQFVTFLQQCTTAKFKTPKVVNFIYSAELEEQDYAVLVNRYYKLRKRMKHLLLQQLKFTNACLTIEEQELNFARLLISRNEYQPALEKLQKLEKHCWEHSIYELLSDIIFLSFRCGGAIYDITEFDGFGTIEERLNLAVKLQQALQQIKVLAQKSTQSYQLEHYKSILSKLKRICNKHPKNIRFEYIYRYIAFCRGSIVSEVLEKSRNAVSRHLNRLLQIQKEHPSLVCLHFEPFYKENNKTNITEHQLLFYAECNQANLVLETYAKIEEYEKKHPFLSLNKTEVLYYNRSTAFSYIQHYDKSIELAKMLLDFYESYELENRKIHAYLKIAEVHIATFPRFSKEEMAANLAIIEKRIKVLPQKTAYEKIIMQHSQLVANQVMFLIGKEALAIKRFLKKPYPALPNSRQIDYHLIEECFIAIYNEELEKVKVFHQQFKQRQQAAILRIEKNFYGCCIRLCQYFIQKMNKTIQAQRL